jgi:hypothetical protein
MAPTSQDIKTPPAEKANDSGRLIKQLKAVMGDSYVLTSPESTRATASIQGSAAPQSVLTGADRYVRVCLGIRFPRRRGQTRCVGG